MRAKFTSKLHERVIGMVLGVIADSERLADAMLANLQEIFGSRVFDTMVAMIVENNLGGEMDIRTAVMQRPDLFERAFIGILCDVGEREDFGKRVQQTANGISP